MTCLLQPVTGHTTAGDGTVSTTLGTAVYSGKCKLQSYEPFPQQGNVGGTVVTSQRTSLHIPVGSCTPQVGMVATITACTLDPTLVGMRLRVVALLHKSAATAYRLGVDETPGESFTEA